MAVKENTLMLRTLVTLSLFLAAVTEGLAVEGLSQYRWKNRVLVLFGDKADRDVARQIDFLKRKEADLADRDMVVLHVTKDRVIPVYGEAPAAAADGLHSELKAPNGFELVLIGKDGGVKLRSREPTTSAEIFDLIDRMPMRRAGDR
jgi:hypothetical protein